MKIEKGLQPNHSDWFRYVASFYDEDRAEKLYPEFLQFIMDLLSRSEEKKWDWDLDSVESSLVGKDIAFRVYTSMYGREEILGWLSRNNCHSVSCVIEGDCIYDFRRVDHEIKEFRD